MKLDVSKWRYQRPKSSHDRTHIITQETMLEICDNTINQIPVCSHITLIASRLNQHDKAALYAEFIGQLKDCN